MWTAADFLSDAPKPPSSPSEVAAAGSMAASPVDPRTDLLVSSAETLKSDETLWALYQHCCREYPDMQRDRREMQRRFRTFKKNAKWVHKVNSSSGVTYKVGLNTFADMTKEETERTFCNPYVACEDPPDVPLPSSAKNTVEEDGRPKPVASSSPKAASAATETIDPGTSSAETLQLDKTPWALFEHLFSSEAFAAAATVTTDPRTDELVSSAETLKSDETLWALYEHCCSKYEMQRDRREMQRRFRTFKKKAKWVHKVNKSGVKVGLNMFADMTMEEIQRGYGGYIPMDKADT
jgi:hypothetical protein